MISRNEPQWKRFKYTVGLPLAGSCVAYTIRAASGLFSTEINFILFVVFFLFMTVLVESIYQFNNLLNRILPYKEQVAPRIIVQLAMGAIWSLLLRLLLYELGEPYLGIKLDGMFLAATWFLYILASIIVNGVFITQHFIDEWKQSLVKAAQLEREKSQVQFDNLKNQLNPHFLFNALTSLNSLIYENQGLASQFLQHLSKVYRYVLQNKDKNFVALQTELDFIQNYVFLLRTRFEHALTVTFAIHDSVRDKAIVPVTLQILIENALKHNVVDKDRPLSIKIETVDDYLVVSNNLQVRKLVETSNKQGLDNLRSLYSFLTDRPVKVVADDVSFAVSVPLV